MPSCHDRLREVTPSARRGVDDVNDGSAIQSLTPSELKRDGAVTWPTPTQCSVTSPRKRWRERRVPIHDPKRPRSLTASQPDSRADLVDGKVARTYGRSRHTQRPDRLHARVAEPVS